MNLLKFTALLASVALVPYIYKKYMDEAVPVAAENNTRYDIDDCITEDEL